MWTRSSYYFAVFAIASLLLGTLTRSWVFFVAFIGIITVFAFSLMGTPSSEFDLKVARKAEDKELYEDDDIWVEVYLKNEGERIDYLEIKDSLPPKVELVERSNHTVFQLDEGEIKKLRYKVSCPITGEYEIGPVEVRYRDPLDFFMEDKEFKSKMDIHVLPKIQEMEKAKVRPSYTKNWLGNIKSSSIGIGTEFYSLREYHIGDELRKINWKATARSQTPITNEFEGEKSGDVIIAVDGYIEGNVGTEKYNTTRASVRAAASLASSILKDRNRVGLIVLGDYLDWIYPGTGRDQFYKIMDSLSKLKPGQWEFRDLKWLIRRFFPSRSLIIFISPLIQQDVTDTIIDICMSEYDVMVLSPNPVEVERKIEEDYDPVTSEIMEMERENILDKIWNYSVVIDWSIDEPLEAKLEEVIRYWERK